MLGLSMAAACSAVPSEVTVESQGASTGGSATDTDPPVADDSGTTSGIDTDSGSEDTGPQSVCGDGVTEGDEECDLGDDNGTGDYCRDDCRNNICGDGYVAVGELCDDGNDINDDECTNKCGPTSCGDGKIQPPEQCDDGKLNSETGACLPNCSEASCGDLNIEEGEEVCDGSNVGAATCMTEGFDGGTLLCSAECNELETSNCFSCGNDVVEPASMEECDGADLQGQSCDDFAPMDTTPSGGALVCTKACDLDSSSCTFCGDGVREGTEECDGADLNGQDCGSQGFTNGVLGCAADCTFNTASCTTCGDGVIEGTEECDGENLGGATCGDVGLPSGDPICNPLTCTLNYGACYECGNGTIEGPELCDGAELGGETCESFSAAFGDGDLACAADCLDYDISDCCLVAGQFCGTSDGACCSESCSETLCEEG